MQAGENIVYRNLSGTGGVILRLESGLNLTQIFRSIGSKPYYIEDPITSGAYITRPSTGAGSQITEGLPLTIGKQPKINNIFTTNITCKNEFAAYTMPPHGINQGTASIIGIKTISYKFAREASI